MLPHEGLASDKIHLFTQWPRMGSGGLTELKKKLDEIKDCRLCVIDTFTKFRPMTKANRNQFEADYEVGTKIKQIADDYNLALKVIHHMRKTISEDPFDDISGTFGVTASADSVLLLIRKHGQADGELKITGRDVEPANYALRFDSDLLSWIVLGKAEEIQSTESRQKIYDVLADTGKYLKVKDIADLTGLKLDYVYVTTKRMADRGDIDKRKKEYGIKKDKNVV
jgi:hypothetical protein